MCTTFTYVLDIIVCNSLVTTPTCAQFCNNRLVLCSYAPPAHYSGQPLRQGCGRHTSSFGCVPLRTIVFPVSLADSGLLVLSVIHSLVSYQTPFPPHDYAKCRRALLGALLRPHLPAKNIWQPKLPSSLVCPKVGSHRFGITCPICLWARSAPSLSQPPRESLLLPHVSFRQISFDSFPIDTHLSSPSLTIATYNVNGLVERKLPAIIHLFAQQKVDVLLLVDSRLNAISHKHISTLLRSSLHPQLFVASALGFPSTPTSPSIGGLTVLIHPRWTGHLHPFTPDLHSPHTLARIKFRTSTNFLQLIFTYIPVPPSSD